MRLGILIMQWIAECLSCDYGTISLNFKDGCGHILHQECSSQSRETCSSTPSRSALPIVPIHVCAHNEPRRLLAS